MNKLIILLAVAAIPLAAPRAQTAGQWRSYLSYYNTSIVAEGNEYVFAVAGGSLFSYRKDDGSVRYYSKENGLNDNQIVGLSFNSSEKTFVVVYASGSIDLVSESHTVYNIPFLKTSGNIQDKTVNSIYNYKEYAYLSANFGVMTVDIKKREIKETTFLNVPVYSTAVMGDEIYASTSAGVLSAPMSSNLINPQNWKAYGLNITGVTAADSVKGICVFRDGLCVLLKNKGVYWQSGSETIRMINSSSLKGIKIENGKLIAFSPAEIFIYSSLEEFDKGTVSNIADVSSFKDANVFWLATGEGGLLSIRRIDANQYSADVSIVNSNSPKYNYDSFMKMHNGKLYIAGGGRWSNRFFRPAVIMAYDTFSHSWRNWANISGAQDATCIAVDPANENHLFVSTWGEGVYEIEDSVVVEHYNHTNSSLATIFPNSSEAGRYVRTEGITYDPEGNLWMTNSEVGSTIVIRKANGEWTSLACPDIANAVLADKILVASTGLKWINLVRDKKSGIFVLDDKGTIDEAADDESAYYGSLSDLQGDIGAKEFTCIVEDLKGQIWIGTNRGPVYIPVPSRGPQGTMICQRLIYTNEYGVLDYFLKDERINAMAIDGGNRKWIGTENSGLYLISEDGLQVIEHFTASDSPLLSDCIQSLAIDNRTGELFVGTDKGLISYTGDAINGAEKYSNVYAYPNPVRPDFASNVIITGLMYDSGVKITDARGFLVFQGRSNGGQISWNCHNQSGGAVVPGIYLVLASDPDGNESVVTKIAVVR